MSDTPLLHVDDLSVDFATDDGVVHAVDGVSFSIGPGEVLGIVGESGSGKSVTSMTLLGLTRSGSTTVSGTAEFDGEDLVAMDEDRLRTIRGGPISMIFQDPLSSLHPFFKIGDQLVEAYRVHHQVSKKVARARAIEMLGLVGIPEPAKRVDGYPHEFSGGMRQRVMIAMALINEPRLLIADEPTTALDVTVQAQILDLLDRLRREMQMAMVIITHDLGVVAQVADEIAVMYAGRIVEHGRTTTLFAQPEHPYTWGLLRSIPRLDVPREDPLVPISGRPPSLIQRPPGCHFHPRCPYAQPSHRVIDPRLEPLADDPDHQVACLLAPQTRRALWAELQTGIEPEEAISRVPIVDEAPEEATGV
jgi:peptide/nickel transport system ATP-binding protein